MLPIAIMPLVAFPLLAATEMRTMTMQFSPRDNCYASHQAKRGHPLLWLFVALIFAMAMYPDKAHAQIMGSIEVNIPFQFHAGNAKLPPGNYSIRVLDSSEPTIMEISSADGSTSALFEVRNVEANSTPGKSELIFNKYGNRYFLAKVFDEGNPSGSALSKSSYEKKISEAAAETQAHIPAHHQGQQQGK
jgi:hypothetical protein